MGVCSCFCSRKGFVWIAWAINTFVSAVYCALSLNTFYNLQTVKFLDDSRSSVIAYKNGLLGSCMIGFLIVLFFIIYSFIILLSRFFTDLRTGYGFMMGTCVHTAWFTLLAGLVLNAQQDLATNLKRVGRWTDTDANAYTATYGFGYILVGTYLIFFLILVWYRRHYETAAAAAPSAPADPTKNAAQQYLSMTSMPAGHGTTV